MHLATLIFCCLAGLLARFLVKFYHARRGVQRLREAGLPMPPFSFATGHLGTVKAASGALPRRATMHTVMRRISEQFPGGIFYINLWPFSGTWAVVTSPGVASQVQALNLSKPDILRGPLDTITGGPSLMTLGGDAWKQWRNLFNPGFSPNYLFQLAPLVVEEIQVFCGLLREQATKGGFFQLEPLTLRLTVDLIASIALDTQLRCQTRPSLLASALQRQIEWTSFGTTLNPLRRYLTIRPLVLWWNSRRMDTFINAEIDKRLDELEKPPSADLGSKRSPGQKSVMSMVLRQFLAEQKQAGASRSASIASFRSMVTSQLRLFLFAGRDTTSSTLLYCFYLLGKDEKALKKVREEHTRVLGSEIGDAGRIINESPHKLNLLPYTTAVIREALRLFPPSASLRQGRAGADLFDDNNRRCPTEGCYVWSLTVGVHRNPRAWGDTAHEFRPERWLHDNDDDGKRDGNDGPPAPGKGSWRAFEAGPRNCIGQSLAMLELRIALVLTLREFDIVPAYPEWDARRPGPSMKTVDGERAYQAEKGGGGAHPADGLPCRVSLRT